MNSQSLAIVAAAFAAMGAGQVAAQASESDVARGLAATCASCHGTGGVSQGTPGSLAGMNKGELVQKMHDFKDGKRPATVMQQLARGYSDEQIERIAGWYAAQRTPK